MSKVLTKAKSHFAEISNKGMESFEVPEWDTTVYWKVGGLNFASQSAVIELQNAGKSADALVETWKCAFEGECLRSRHALCLL